MKHYVIDYTRIFIILKKIQKSTLFSKLLDPKNNLAVSYSTIIIEQKTQSDYKLKALIITLLAILVIFMKQLCNRRQVLKRVLFLQCLKLKQ